MIDRLDLPGRYRVELEALLRKYVPDVEAWAYGSRVNGESHEGSDLDLVLRGPNLRPLGAEYLDLIEALEKSNIPILVQAHDWTRLPKSFHKEIERDYAVVQEARDKRTVPGEWIDCTLADACNAINYGLTASASDRPEGPKFLRITDIVSGQINWKTVPHVVADEATISKYRILDGDIVVARTGASTGTSAYVKNPPPAVFASYLVRLQASPQFDARFLGYYLKSTEFGEFIRGVLGDKSAQPNASASTMTAAPLRAPKSKAEQRAIAHVLGTLDDKIELNRRTNETLEEMARALFKSWFVDFEPVRAKMEGRWRRGESLPGLPADHYDLFPDRLVPSELGEIPEGWEVQPLPNLIDFKEGPGIRHWQYTNSSEGIRFINIRCIQGGDLILDTANRINSKEANGRYAHFHVRANDIVVSTSGTLGRSAVVRTSHLPLILNTSVIRFRPNQNATTLSHLYGYIKSRTFLDELEMSASGSVQKNFGPIHLRQMRLVRPAYNCLIRYEETAGPLIHKLISKRAENEALAAHRDALLPKLVTGVFRTQEISSGISS